MASNHRENLRAELIEAAQALLHEQGHAAISVRQLALRVGVSSGAPYHHFPDRRSLLIALALDGFDSLDTLAKGILARHAEVPEQAILALAAQFLGFCADHPQLVDLMYESELTRPMDDGLKPAFEGAFEMLVDAVHRGLPGASRQVAVNRSVSFWSTLFGFARLSRNQLLDPFGGDDGDWRDLIIAEATDAVLRPFS